MVFDGRFVGANTSYRAYRFAWRGSPQSPPSVAAASSAAATIVYASWNGATEVASWRVLAGARGALKTITTAPRRGFETSIAISRQAYVEVQALDSSGKVLGTSAIVAPS